MNKEAVSADRRFDFWLWWAVFLYVANLVGWASFLIRRSIYG